MLVANTNTGERVNSQQLSEEEYRDTDFFCPVCEEPVTWVKRSINGRVAHFRHLEEQAHESVSESPEHERLKLSLYETYDGRNDIRFATLEQQIGEQFADVFVVTKDYEQVAIEVQLSYQSSEEFKRRTKNYEQRGLSTLWLAGEKDYMDEKEISGTSGYSYKDPLKWLQRQYFGRVYFIQQLNNSFEIKPFRFENAPKSNFDGFYSCPQCRFRSGYEIQCADCGIVMDKVSSGAKYKSLAKLKSGDKVDDLSLLVPERSGEMPYREYNIARFYDSKFW